MDDKPVNSLHRYAMTYGAYAAIALCAISFTLYLMDAFFSNRFVILNYIVISIFIYTGISRFRDQYSNGIISYSRALGVGTYIIFWASVIVGFYSYLMYRFVDPSLFTQFLDNLSEALKNSKMSEEQVNITINFYHMALSPAIMGLSQLFGVTFMGFIFSLFIALAVRRKAIQQPTDTNMF